MIAVRAVDMESARTVACLELPGVPRVGEELVADDRWTVRGVSWNLDTSGNSLHYVHLDVQRSP